MRNFNNNRRRSFARTNRAAVRRRMPVIGERDLAVCRITGSSEPPQNRSDPTITKVIRLSYDYTGAAFSQAVSMAMLMQQDALDYTGTNVARYSQGRVIRVEGWFSVAGGAPGNPPLFAITDAYVNSSFTDRVGPGVDFAHIAFRPSLLQRMNTASSTSSGAQLTATVSAQAGVTGKVILDVTVAMN